MQHDESWEQRYLSLVPEKLNRADVRLLLDLWIENPYRLQRSLQAFVTTSENKEAEP